MNRGSLLTDLPGNTCFIGISFHHLKRREGDVVYASVAQAFSNEIEPFLFTSGYVPWWDEYSGPHIPAPLQIGSCGSSDMRQRAREILALTKMNWNSTEGIGRYPITISFARKVGNLMTELADNQIPNLSYRFYM